MSTAPCRPTAAILQVHRMAGNIASAHRPRHPFFRCRSPQPAPHRQLLTPLPLPTERRHDGCFLHGFSDSCLLIPDSLWSSP
jgi:hypothetical protein